MASTNEKLQQIEDRWLYMESKMFDMEQRVSSLQDVAIRVPLLEQEISKLNLHTEDWKTEIGATTFAFMVCQRHLRVRIFLNF